MIADLAIDDESDEGNQNIHAHIMTTVRPLNEFFIKELKKMDEPTTEFDPIIWNLKLDYVKVDDYRNIKFVFKNRIRI